MKRFLLVLVLLYSVSAMYAQVTKRVFTVKESVGSRNQLYENVSRKSYLNVGYQRLTMKQSGGMELKSNLGLLSSVGKIYLLSNEPKIFDCGIDVVWADLNYINYQLEFRESKYVAQKTYHQVDIGMQGGVIFVFRSASLGFNVRVFVRYMPGFSAMCVDEDWYGNYANFVVAGSSLSFGSFGIGVDYKWGICDYAVLNWNVDNEEDGRDVPASFPSSRYSGIRAYLVYHF